MKYFMTLIAALVAISSVGSASAQSKGLASPADVAAQLAELNKKLDACNADVATQKQSAADFEQEAKDCYDAYCPDHPNDPHCKKLHAATKPPPPAVKKAPAVCRLPDGSTEELVGAHCDCGDPRFVDVVSRTFKERVCVPKAKAFADLAARVDALEALGKDVAALREQLKVLQGLEGEHFAQLQNQLNQELAAIAENSRRIKALEDAMGGVREDLVQQKADIERAQAAADKANERLDTLEPRVAKLEQGGHGPRGASGQSADLDGVLGFGFRGGAGADLRLGVHAGYENRFSAKSPLALSIGAGLLVEAAHQNNTYGTLAVPEADASLRIYAADHVAIDLGGTYFAYLMAEHSAGYHGMPSQWVGSAGGPHIGVYGKFSKAVNGFVRCGVGFGSENHLDQSQTRTYRVNGHPAQPWCLAGLGATFGL